MSNYKTILFKDKYTGGYHDLKCIYIDEQFNNWVKDKDNIEIIDIKLIVTEHNDAMLVFYKETDEKSKSKSTDEFLYKDDFLFRILMATYNENKEYLDHDPLKMSYEDLKKLRWHISRQCPNFKPEHRRCDTARCDKECGFFSSYQMDLDNRIKEYYTGGHPDDTE